MILCNIVNLLFKKFDWFPKCLFLRALWQPIKYMQIHTQRLALQTLIKYLNALQVRRLSDLSPSSKKRIRVRSYQKVCDSVGVMPLQTDSEDYIKNEVIHEENGDLFTIVVMPINRPLDTDIYFWIQFKFNENKTVHVCTDVASISKEDSDALLQKICGCEENHIYEEDQAVTIIKGLLEKLQANPQHFEKIYGELQ